jgi:KaiC/GvpD/RAD55 family RecA-like ATPase
MAITFKYAGASFTVDTPQEAADTIALLKRQEAEAAIDEARSRFSGYQKEHEHLLKAYDESKFAWTPDYFRALISRLGEAQKLALSVLVTRCSISDAEMRNALKVPGNQALAGVLSGISKQAAALNIPAWAIFEFENFRVGGKRRSDYLVVDKFRQIAADLNWPPPALLASHKS